MSKAERELRLRVRSTAYGDVQEHLSKYGSITTGQLSDLLDSVRRQFPGIRLGPEGVWGVAVQEDALTALQLADPTLELLRAELQVLDNQDLALGIEMHIGIIEKFIDTARGLGLTDSGGTT